jgi:DNA gyrase subunit A
VRQTDGTQNVFIATHDGMSICFDENDARPMGRVAVGVRGIRLRSGDYVVGAGVSGAGTALLSVTENGYGKRTPVEEYTVQYRGGQGLKNYNVTDKTGRVADMKIVNDEDDLLVVSDDGTIIRMAVSDISVLGRATQGVRVMNVNGGAKVISIARTDKEDEPEDGDGVPTDAAPEEDEVPSAPEE